jgi:hypothetical protein
MAIPALVLGGAMVGSSLLNANAAKKAGKDQAEATMKAAQLQYDAAIAAGASHVEAAGIAAAAQERAAGLQADASRQAAQLQYDAAIAAGKSQQEAANIAANAQIETGKIAAEAARFRPYSITTGFGSSSFDTAKDTGTYTLDPRLAAFRDQYYGGAQDVLNQQQGFDPLEMARQVYGEQQGLMQPGRQAEDVALRQAMLSSGRIGLGVSGGAAGAGADGMLNPEQFSLDRARALADAQLAANSRDYGQQYLDTLISRGQGLLTYGTGLESLGMGSMTAGLEAGAKSAQSQANQAQALLSSGNAAAQSRLSGAEAAALGQLNAANSLASGITGSAGYLAGGITGGAQTMLSGADAAARARLSGANTLAQGGLDSASQRIAGNLAEKQAYANLLQQGASLWGLGSTTTNSFVPNATPISTQASYAPGSTNALFQSYIR